MRTYIRIVLLAALGTVAAMDTVSAHHSPAQYEMSEVIAKDATVIRFEFRNPHSYILVRDSDDAEWMLETSSAVRLRRKGWSIALFSPGDRISFRAHANRNPQKNRLYLNSITAPSGETFALLEEGGDAPEPEPSEAATSLAGIWRVDTGNFDELFDSFEQYELTEKAEQARAAYDETRDPVADCIAYPTPQLVLVSYIYPMRIEISDQAVVFHHEFFNTTRTVWMDGRGHPADTSRSNQGHSVGHWDGATLVVDTRYFADHRNPMMGDFPSGAERHVIERYTLGDDGTTATVDVVVEDPEYIVEPMRFRLNLQYAPDVELQDFECDPEIARRFTE